ncbi:uncharacterized protein LOC141678570 [Apium graveolens]|uniref:uncharacterized protein LOC141678570 n=1 Tax=Apium graveolens TaxID=4045 RepID=UPI003D798598
MDKNDEKSTNNRTIDNNDTINNDVNRSSSDESRRLVRSGEETGLTERLNEILIEDREDDLVFEEENVLQWLQALDMQVMGACRADERLKPMLKRNGGSSGVADDCLLAQLSQHFEPSEVAMLARCLCIPLVTIRVGKIDKQGTQLCPTSTRGSLTLTLLPTSNLRISFIGDDGQMERLATLASSSSCSSSSVEIEKILADISGRSFVMRITSCDDFYFWCSEKSKLLGDELIDKLNNLLTKKPSLAELTGISESRLGCFATRLRSYLGGPTVTQNQTNSVALATLPSDVLDIQFPASSNKQARPRHNGNQAGKANAFYMGSLSPRSGSFKEGLLRNLSSLKISSRDKFRRRGESHLSSGDNVSSPLQTNSDQTGANEKDNLKEINGNISSLTSSSLDSFGKSTELPPLSLAASNSPLSFISPYYCWCPPVTPTLQCAVAPIQFPISSTESFCLPPLSSLLSTSMPSSLLAHESPLELSEIPSLDFPPFLPDPLVRLPLSMASSQQIATFTPLMCDPIVHIPVIDICSSGPVYLVSAGPAISTTIPSLHPTHPLIPASDSMIESSARETLRLLISNSSQTNSQLMSVFPSVLTSTGEAQSILAHGSRGLYEGANDVGNIANSIAAMSMVSLSERSGGNSSVFNRCLSQGDMVDQLEKQGGGGSGGTCLDDEGRGGLVD